MKFVSLHHHTTYSYGDGFGLPEAHAARAAELGMAALAATEHGNVSSHVKLEIACRKYGLRPLFGMEAYTGPDNMREAKNMRKWHQTLLASDQEGLNNLYKLVSRSWDEGFYRWPTITLGMYEGNTAGLIATTGCLDGKLACDILGGKGLDPSEASLRRGRRTLGRFRELFGDRLYLEVQRFPELERCRNLNPIYERLSKIFKIPLVATADVHYPRPEQNEIQKILHASSRKTGTVVAAEQDWEYEIKLTHPLSDEQVVKQMRETGLSRSAAEQAVANTAEVAERCNVVLPKMDRVRYPIAEDDMKPWPKPAIRKRHNHAC